MKKIKKLKNVKRVYLRKGINKRSKK